MTVSPLTGKDVAFSLEPDHYWKPWRSEISEALQSLDRLKTAEVGDSYTVIVHAGRRRTPWAASCRLRIVTRRGRAASIQ